MQYSVTRSWLIFFINGEFPQRHMYNIYLFVLGVRQDDHFVNIDMLFTLYYAYATIMQWWRLSTLRNKLNGTLTAQNALVMSSSQSIHDSRNQRSLENLLFRTDNRIACTVVPKVIILSQLRLHSYQFSILAKA